MPVLPDGTYPVMAERIGTAEQLMVRPNPPIKLAKQFQRLYLKPVRLPKWFRDMQKETGVTGGFSRGADVLRLLGPMLRESARLAQERFIVMPLDIKNKPLAVAEVSLGTLDASMVHPRDVFGAVIASNAGGVIVAHNHPSGDPEPSAEDIAMTRRLAEAGQLLGIPLLDHIVVGSKGFVSLAERGVV